jgi:hypothetical protein
MIKFPKDNLHRIVLFLVITLVTLIIGLLIASQLEKDDEVPEPTVERLEVSDDVIVVGDTIYRYDSSGTATSIALTASDSRYYYLYIGVQDSFYQDMVKLDTENEEVVWQTTVDTEHQYYQEMLLKDDQLLLTGKTGVTPTELQKDVELVISAETGEVINN